MLAVPAKALLVDNAARSRPYRLTGTSLVDDFYEARSAGSISKMRKIGHDHEHENEHEHEHKYEDEEQEQEAEGRGGVRPVEGT